MNPFLQDALAKAGMEKEAARGPVTKMMQGMASYLRKDPRKGGAILGASRYAGHGGNVGAVGGALYGGLKKDEEGNRGGVGGAIKGGLVGSAAGFAGGAALGAARGAIGGRHYINKTMAPAFRVARQRDAQLAAMEGMKTAALASPFDSFMEYVKVAAEAERQPLPYAVDHPYMNMFQRQMGGLGKGTGIGAAIGATGGAAVGLATGNPMNAIPLALGGAAAGGLVGTLPGAIAGTVDAVKQHHGAATQLEAEGHRLHPVVRHPYLTNAAIGTVLGAPTLGVGALPAQGVSALAHHYAKKEAAVVGPTPMHMIAGTAAGAGIGALTGLKKDEQGNTHVLRNAAIGAGAGLVGGGAGGMAIGNRAAIQAAAGKAVDGAKGKVNIMRDAIKEKKQLFSDAVEAGRQAAAQA